MRCAHVRGVGVLASAILATCSAHAAPITVVDSSPVYASLESAARAATAAALGLSRVYEYGGVLVSCPDGYRYSEPVTIRETHRVEYRARIIGDCTLAGIYHTHPGADGRPREFSADDVTVADVLGVPSFVGVAVDGSLRALYPDVRSTVHLGSVHRQTQS